MGRVEGKVALISGGARGQGRSHARMLAAEGADIIAVDLCEDIETNEYPLARPEDLDETARLVEKEGRRAHTEIADVRDRAALAAAIDRGVAEFRDVSRFAGDGKWHEAHGRCGRAIKILLCSFRFLRFRVDRLQPEPEAGNHIKD